MYWLREAATPVIVRKGALANNVPHHDLHITKGRWRYIDDGLLANGAPAESYRDDGNRWLFRNANSG